MFYLLTTYLLAVIDVKANNAKVKLSKVKALRAATATAMRHWLKQ